MRSKKIFLERFYDDQARLTIAKLALAKYLKLDKEDKIKLYSDYIKGLELEMTDYINRSKKIVNKINFTKESAKHRIDPDKQKKFTKEIIGYEMTIDDLQKWVNEK